MSKKLLKASFNVLALKFIEMANTSRWSIDEMHQNTKKLEKYINRLYGHIEQAKFGILNDMLHEEISADALIRYNAQLLILEDILDLKMYENEK